MPQTLPRIGARALAAHSRIFFSGSFDLEVTAWAPSRLTSCTCISHTGLEESSGASTLPPGPAHPPPASKFPPNRPWRACRQNERHNNSERRKARREHGPTRLCYSYEYPFGRSQDRHGQLGDITSRPEQSTLYLSTNTVALPLQLKSSYLARTFFRSSASLPACLDRIVVTSWSLFVGQCSV